MTYLTPKMVEARLAKAVSALGQQGSRAPHPPCPLDGGPEGALLWFLWLEPQDAQLLWMKVERTPWKVICQDFGISRATANRRVEYLLSVLAWKLNHQRVPAKWSCRYHIERTRDMSSSM